MARPPPDILWVDLFSLARLAPELPLVDNIDNQLQLLADGVDDGAPDLPSILAPAGVQVGYALRRRYLNLRIQGSLMEMLHAEYGYLILGDAYA